MGDKVANDLMHNATYKVIERLVRSEEGIMLAVQATNMDRPALCGVDVLLRRELGTDTRGLIMELGMQVTRSRS